MGQYRLSETGRQRGPPPSRASAAFRPRARGADPAGWGVPGGGPGARGSALAQLGRPAGWSSLGPLHAEAPVPNRPVGALQRALATGLAFALADGVASGVLRLPASLWAAVLALGLLGGLVAGLLGTFLRRPGAGAALLLAALTCLQGAALASKGLEGTPRLVGFGLALAGGVLAGALTFGGRPAWLAALLLPLGTGLALPGATWLGLTWGLAVPLVLLLPPRARLAPFLLAPLFHPQRAGGLAPLERAPAPAAALSSGPDVVLFVIDTLRADELPPEGALAQFAREGVRFTQCTSSAPWTLPSMGSLLTGLYPSQHGAVNAATPLAPELETLAERFAAAGYRTGAFTGGAFVGPAHRLDQGFEHFDAGAERRFAPLGPHLPLVWQLAKNRYLPLRPLVRAVDEYRGLAGVLDAAERWLARGDGRPTFLLLHTYQAHDYYLYDADTDDAVRTGGAPPRFAARLSVHPGELADATQEELDHFRALYRARIAALDGLFPELRRRVEARLRGAPLWILTADHGEGFDAELGRVHHGGRLHDDLLRVPLALVGPGLAPRVVEEPVRHVDVAPTVLALAGLEPLPGVAGVSLLPALAGAEPFPPLAFAEERAHGNALLALRSAEWKWIRGPGLDQRFALARDPLERVPDSGPAPRDLLEALEEFPRRYPARALREEELDAATAEHLRALGYVE